MNDMELHVDPTRKVKGDGTGIWVRAKCGDKFGSYDIAVLDDASLTTWLRSRSGANVWMENVVSLLLVDFRE